LINSKFFKSKERELREIVDYCKAKNWVLDRYSSFSIKLNKNIFIICSYENIYIVDISGNILHPITDIDINIKNHLFLYNNSNYETIFHTHSPYSTAISLIGDRFKEDRILSLKLDIMVVDDIKTINDKTYLLRGNGLISCGYSTKDTLGLLQSIEYIFQISLTTKNNYNKIPYF